MQNLVLLAMKAAENAFAGLGHSASNTSLCSASYQQSWRVRPGQSMHTMNKELSWSKPHNAEGGCLRACRGMLKLHKLPKGVPQFLPRPASNDLLVSVWVCGQDQSLRLLHGLDNLLQTTFTFTRCIESRSQEAHRKFFLYMPGDGFALSVWVCCQDQSLSLLHGLRNLLQPWLGALEVLP